MQLVIYARGVNKEAVVMKNSQQHLGNEANAILCKKFQLCSQATFSVSQKPGNDVIFLMTSLLLRIFLVSFNLQSAICGLWSAVCGLRSAVCGLRFANVIHRQVDKKRKVDCYCRKLFISEKKLEDRLSMSESETALIFNLKFANINFPRVRKRSRIP